MSSTSAGLVVQAVQKLMAQYEVPMLGLLCIPVTLAACAGLSGQDSVELSDHLCRLYVCTTEREALLALATLLRTHCSLQRLLEVLACQLRQVHTTASAVVLWESTHPLLCTLTTCAKFSPIMLVTVHDLLASVFEAGSKTALATTAPEADRVLVCLQSLYEVYIAIVRQQRVLELLKPAEVLLRYCVYMCSSN